MGSIGYKGHIGDSEGSGSMCRRGGLEQSIARGIIAERQVGSV